MRYGLQLYSVRDSAEKNYEDTLRQVAEMGYSMVEPAGFMGHSAEEVAGWLKKYGLTVCSTHTELRRLEEHLEEEIAYHKAIGCNDIIIPGASISTKEDVAYLVDAVNRIQPILEKEGMRLHFHNHSKEFIPNKDGQIVEEILAEQTNVLFEIDTFWAFNAGKRAVDLLEQYKDRIQFIHLKDGIPQDWSNPESRAKGRSVGSGEAPVEEVRRKAMEMGLTIVVESEGLDPTGLEEVKRCIDYLKAPDAKNMAK